MDGAFRVGDFLVEPQLNRIRDASRTAHIAAKAMEVLVYLAAHPKEVLPKERIIQAVWADTFVTDDVLTHAISELRKAFEDDAKQPSFIQTIPRKGYRLIAPVSRPEPRSPPPQRGLRWAPWAVAVLLLAAISGTFWLSTGSDSKQSTPHFELIPLTSYPGTERGPTFSPDGSQVAFTWDGGEGGHADIYIKVIGTEEPRRLTFDPASDGSPAWSPDGRFIAFLRETTPGTSEIRLISPNGGAERVLAAVLATPNDGLAWSPDCGSLAVADRSSLSESRSIFLLNAENGTKRRLTFAPVDSETGDWKPAFSPDGQTVAFLRRGGIYSTDVWLVSLAGGELRKLLSTTAAVGAGGAGEGGTGLAFSAGGEEIIFNGPRSFPDRTPASLLFLWRFSLSGGRAQRLADTVEAREIAVSRAGNRLAYSRDRSDYDIWRLDLLDPEKPPLRFITSTALDVNPQYSPDNRQVVFTSQRGGENELWRADADGSNLLQLTSLRAVGSPRWSPDGKEIVFDLAANQNHDVYVVSSSGGPPRRITRNPAEDVRPSWSRDGKWIYFSSKRSGAWQVWKIPRQGEDKGAARQVTRQGGFATIESMDGRFLYFSKRRSVGLDSKNSIWRVPTEGGKEQVVIETLNSSDTNWDVTAKGIYFVDRTSTADAKWTVNLLNFADGSVSRVSQLRFPPFLSGPSFGVSSDSRWILSAQLQSGSDLMLIENFR